MKPHTHQISKVMPIIPADGHGFRFLGKKYGGKFATLCESFTNFAL